MTVQPGERKVALIGAPLDLGAGRRGVDMGPSAIRYAGLEQHLRATLGVETVDLGNIEAPVAESMEAGDERARFLPQILELCDRVASLVAEARSRGETPLVLGGDHSVALGTLVGMASAHGPGGVLWLDAHGDLNTPESSPTGNVHGMVLAAALGLGGAAFAREGWTMPGGRARTARPRRRPVARPGRAGAAEGPRREGLHDERTSTASASSGACARRSRTPPEPPSCT